MKVPATTANWIPEHLKRGTAASLSKGDQFKQAIESIGRVENVDLLDISSEGRELAAGDIQHKPAVYWGGTEINAALDKSLQGQPENIKDGVNSIIQNNFYPQGDLSQDERNALLDAGMAQARFIADNYIKDPKNKDLFLSTIQQIGAIAKTGEMDASTGQMKYANLPSRPAGAPEDYIHPSELMERFDPQTFEKYKNATDITEKLSILLKFVKTSGRNQEWRDEFREETKALKQKLADTDTGSRFKNTDTSSLSAFVSDMFKRIQPADSPALTANIHAFAAIFGQSKP
ncbi:hypothetical protein ACX93W_03230 [Paenibacillus sp. CAU 1782]